MLERLHMPEKVFFGFEFHSLMKRNESPVTKQKDSGQGSALRHIIEMLTKDPETSPIFFCFVFFAVRPVHQANIKLSIISGG